MPEMQVHSESLPDPRYHARIAIFSGTEQKLLFTDYTVNLSSGGLFIETAKILPVDTQLIVKFKLPNKDNVISCNTRVAWINEPGELKKPSLPPGMGIQFLDLSLDDMHVIRAFIEKVGLVPTW